MTKIDKALDGIGRQAQAAWSRLKAGARSWPDWALIGEALQAAQRWAMDAAGIDHPTGYRYNQLVGDWLRRYKLDEIDKGARSRLLDIMEHRAEVEAFRANLDTTTRLSLVHPNGLHRAWKRGTSAVKPADRKLTAAREAARVQELLAALADRDRYIKELERELRTSRLSSTSTIRSGVEA